MSNKDYYFSVDYDIRSNKSAWCVIAIGGRNTGKTYSSLKSCVVNDRKFVFLKRTIEDVDLLCAGSGTIGTKVNEYGIDLSPFKSLNRDMRWNIKAFSIKKGLGGFWKCNKQGEPEGAPIGYLLSLNAVTKYKGFDLSECDWLIFDEFIPQPWDRINRKEGEQLLDLYKTIARDREHRGKDPLKLVCLANATSISNPVMNILEVTDIVAEMQNRGEEKRMLDDRGILIHIIKDHPEFYKKEKDSMLYKSMGQTAWGQMAFENKFAYNDLSNIGRTSLKGYKPVCAVSYKHDNYYIYMKEGQYYMCRSRHDSDNIYNLNRENDQKLFFSEYVFELREACIEGKMLFETYTMYDLIINYKKFFKM